MTKGFKTALRTSAAILVLGLPTTAMAQQTAAEDDGAPAEIVVTAQKREQRLQDVPVALTVISGDALANQGGVNIENAQYLVPSLNFRKSGTTLNQFLFLRGIGTANFSIAAEPSVSAVLDGVVLANAGEAFADLVDVERIEVLRGPQGTLFGKNASAGVVNIVSKRPGKDFGGFLEGGYFFGNGNEYRLRAAIDTPFSDTIRGRFTGFVSNWDGNIRNVTLNRRVNGYDRYGLRGIIEGDATDNLQLTFIADFRKSDDDCCAELIGTTPSNITVQALPVARGDKTRQVAQNLVTHTDEKSYGLSLQADWSFAGLTVTSITSHRWWDNVEIRDGDWLPQAYAGFNQLHDNGPQSSKTFSQELRVASPTGGMIEYVVGAYYSRSNNRRIFTRNDIVCGLAAGAPTTTLVACGTAQATASTFPTGTADFGSIFTNTASFAQATLNATDAFRVIAGLRYTTDQLKVDHIRRTGLAGPGIGASFDAGVFNNGAFNPATGAFIPGASNGIPFRSATTKRNLSGKAGVQLDLSDDNMAYATYARGYKGPAYNVFFNMATINTNVIEAETADSFEVGLKNTFADGRIILNVAGFYAKYKNFQANNPDVVNGVVTTRLTNAGTVSTRGIEIDFIAKPMPNWTVSGGYAYTDAKIDNFRAPPGAPATALIAPGTPLTSAPKSKLSVTTDYRIETGGFADVVLGAALSAQSKQLSQLSPDAAVRAATTIGGYTLLDLSASLVDPDDAWKLSFLVRNVGDTSFAAAIQSGGPGGSYRYVIPREADRYAGLTFRYNFGGK